jgi:hypothetical protein
MLLAQFPKQLLPARNLLFTARGKARRILAKGRR